jgi:zinc protease
MQKWLSRAAFVTALVTVGFVPLAARQAPAPAPQTINLQESVPFDAAVDGDVAQRPQYHVRKTRGSQTACRTARGEDGRSTKRTTGLAHVLEHMAFNGSALQAGRADSLFESTGARLGPHVNAQTGFEDTIYMLDLPSDKPEVVEKGLTAFADFAGGLTLDPKEIDKERGVVIEEWRGGLGAGSRIRDKQIPVLFYHSRYADRLPISEARDP